MTLEVKRASVSSSSCERLNRIYFKWIVNNSKLIENKEKMKIIHEWWSRDCNRETQMRSSGKKMFILLIFPFSYNIYLLMMTNLHFTYNKRRIINLNHSMWVSSSLSSTTTITKKNIIFFFIIIYHTNGSVNQ